MQLCFKLRYSTNHKQEIQIQLRFLKVKNAARVTIQVTNTTRSWFSFSSSCKHNTFVFPQILFIKLDLSCQASPGLIPGFWMGWHLVPDRGNALMHIICSHSTPRNQPSRSPSHSILCSAKNQLVSRRKAYRHVINFSDFLLQPGKCNAWDVPLNPRPVKSDLLLLSASQSLLHPYKDPRHLSWLPPPPRHEMMAEAYEEVG